VGITKKNNVLTELPESLGQLAALTTLNLSGCGALTGLPESLGQLAALTTLNLNGCGALTGLSDSLGMLSALAMLDLCRCDRVTRLPLSFAFLPDTLCLLSSPSLVFPPARIIRQGMPATKAFLLLCHHPLKILLLILAARRCRLRHPPPELWELIHNEFLSHF